MTDTPTVVRNAHQTIIPYYIFKALDWSVVMLSLLPRGACHKCHTQTHK